METPDHFGGAAVGEVCWDGDARSRTSKIPSTEDNARNGSSCGDFVPFSASPKGARSGVSGDGRGPGHSQDLAGGHQAVPGGPGSSGSSSPCCLIISGGAARLLMVNDDCELPPLKVTFEGWLKKLAYFLNQVWIYLEWH